MDTAESSKAPTKVLDSLDEYESMMSSVPVSDQALPTTAPCVYDPAEVYGRHEEFIRLRHLGLSYRQISIEVDCSIGMVSAALNSEVARDRLANLAQGTDEEVRTISSRIVASLGPAMSVLEEILEEGNPLQHSVSLRLRTAQDVLDRGGHGKIVKVEGKHLHGILGEGGLAAVQARVREMELDVARESGALADIGVGDDGAEIVVTATHGASHDELPSEVPTHTGNGAGHTDDNRVYPSKEEGE